MKENSSLKLFEDRKIRTVWDEENEKWYFSIVDVCEVLTDSIDSAAYWRKLKQRLKNEGNERGCDDTNSIKLRMELGYKKRSPIFFTKDK